MSGDTVRNSYSSAADAYMYSFSVVRFVGLVYLVAAVSSPVSSPVTKREKNIGLLLYIINSLQEY